MLDFIERVVPDRIRESYLLKFGVSIAVILVLTSAVALFFYVDITGDVTTNVQEEMELNAVGEANDFADWIDSQEQSARMLSSYGVLTDGSDAEIEATLTEEQESMSSEVYAVHYVDLWTEEITHSSEQGAVGTDIRDLNLTLHVRTEDRVSEFDYRGAMNDDVVYSDVYERDGEQLVAFFGKVAETNGDTAVMIEISASEMADGFADPIDGQYTEVVDTGKGVVEFSGNETAIQTSYREGDESHVVDAIANREHASGIVEYDDTDEVVAYADIGRTDWALVSHAPQSNAYALTSSVARSLGGLIVLSLAGFLVIGATLGRTTARAMDDLATNATALSRGDTDIEIDDDGRLDEVGQVRTAFEGIRQYLGTAAAQADAIARQEFDDPALERDVPGQLGDSLATMRRELESYIDDLEASKADAEASKEEAAQARREAEQLAERLERKAAEFGDVMNDAAEGDFTRRLDEDVDNEALAEIATAFNGMLEDLEATIVDIQELAEDVDRVSADVTGQVEEIERASGEVSESAEEIATATADQSDRFQDVYGEMNDLSATVEEIASTADDVATVSETAADRAEDASEATGEIRTEMNRLENRAEAITDQVAQLDEEMDQIREIVDLIDDIAEQTNLLALNASIEAAGAGEEGDGFAVVANEVKSLAEETGEATQEVDELISSVESSVDETVDEIDRMREQVDEGTAVVDDGIEAIDAIAEQVEEANAGVQSINDATDEQARASERVVTMVDEATEISEETKDETENVAAAAEEQTATISDVSAGTQSLTEMADDLRTSLDAFTVGDETRGVDGAEALENAARDDAGLEADSDDDHALPADGTDEDPRALEAAETDAVPATDETDEVPPADETDVVLEYDERDDSSGE
ncbi:methyl-accepting chemotaxis protein [Halopiger aswanensis]|uniref:Methyl-accepting chemotaxis protein n=1 Tax=Halopiger aswanensis TaxID=148449 RepID=A0A3R7HWE3_9EURY|nr:methyl-accepting chemotaxis protein [Halopiger aswanensis]RKD93452.1 methyl-accepting chemotaxis protein [Halopiger aswanensis]